MGISIDISDLETVDVDPTGLEPVGEESIAEKIFPTSTSMEMGDVKSFAKRTLQAGIDASTFPTRLLGMLRGFDIADPKSAALQPEIEKFEESTNVDNKIQEFADAAQRAASWPPTRQRCLPRQPARCAY